MIPRWLATAAFALVGLAPSVGLLAMLVSGESGPRELLRPVSAHGPIRAVAWFAELAPGPDDGPSLAGRVAADVQRVPDVCSALATTLALPVPDPACEVRCLHLQRWNKLGPKHDTLTVLSQTWRRDPTARSGWRHALPGNLTGCFVFLVAPAVAVGLDLPLTPTGTDESGSSGAGADLPMESVARGTLEGPVVGVRY